MSETRFPIYDVAYNVFGNVGFRAAIATESREDLERILEDEIKEFSLDAKPRIYGIHLTKHFSDRRGIILNTIIDIKSSLNIRF